MGLLGKLDVHGEGDPNARPFADVTPSQADRPLGPATVAMPVYHPGPHSPAPEAAISGWAAGLTCDWGEGHSRGGPKRKLMMELLAFVEITTDLNPGSPSFWGSSGEFLNLSHPPQFPRWEIRLQ